MLKTFILPIILTSFLVLCVKRAEGEHIKNYPRYNPMVPIGQYHKTWRIKPKNNLIPDKKKTPQNTSNCGNILRRFLLFFLSSITSLPRLTP